MQAGTFLADREDVAQLIVAVRDGRPVYLQDVATVTFGADQPEQYVTFGTGPAAALKGIELHGTSPAVTIAVSKKPGDERDRRDRRGARARRATARHARAERR